MDLVLELAQAYGIWLLPGLLIAGAFGAPFPEDIVLITAGYMVYNGWAQAPLAVGLMIPAVVIADHIMYLLGKWLQAKVLPADKLERMAPFFEKYGVGVVFAARFMPGFRGIALLSSGAMGLPIRRFMLTDILAVTIFVPLMLYISYRFGDSIQTLIDAIASAGKWIGIAALALLAIVAVRALLRRRN